MAELLRLSGEIPDPTPLTARIDRQVSDIRERVDALSTWQLAEGDYELRIPTRPPSVPKTFQHKPEVNALDMRFSYRDSLGNKQLVTITRGLTENGSGEGLAEREEDITIDVNSSPDVYRIRPNDARVESRLVVTSPPTPASRDFLNFPDDDDSFHREFRIVPAESRLATLADISRLNLILSAIGRPGNSSVEVKVLETSRNRILGFWQKP